MKRKNKGTAIKKEQVRNHRDRKSLKVFQALYLLKRWLKKKVGGRQRKAEVEIFG